MTAHIARANAHISRLYSHILNNPGVCYKYLECYPKDVDKELAQKLFDEIAYKAIFKNCEASAENLLDPTIAGNIWEDIMEVFPETYYMELMVKHGVAYRFEQDDDVIYGLKEAYNDELIRLLTAKSTK